MRVIAGKARGIQLQTPQGMLTRPTIDRVKEALFSILQFELPGAKVLDLFGGTGQLGIEALSRGASRAVFVDSSREACQLIRSNLKKTHLEQDAVVIQRDYMDYLNQCHEQFRLILLDPPYAEIFLENSIKRITEIDILQSNGIIATERPLGKELPWEFPGFTRSKDYKYGQILLTFYRKIEEEVGYNMKTAIYPGSFDPITSGHLNIIRRAANIFDKLIVCVMVNAGKNPMFTLEEREALIRRVTVDLPNVEVDCSNELLADYARRRGSCVIVKGLRAGSDFENEFQMALVNRKLNPELDTMFLTADSQYMYLSSSMVKELGNYGADLYDFLPEEIIPDFRNKLCNKMEDSL